MRRMTIGLLALVLVIGACGDDDEDRNQEGMPSPQSTYCVEQGGDFVIREIDGGIRIGVCVFPDGSECEDDDFYRGTCRPETGDSELANPASVYCIEQGGESHIREGEGGQYGVCVFPDGSECEEWAFIDGDCSPGDESSGIANPASEYCIAQGGTLDIREGEGGQYGVCVFPDGSECEEWAFLRGECAPG